MIGVQRPANTSQATATGQNWPNPDFIAASLAEARAPGKFTFYTIARPARSALCREPRPQGGP